MTERSKRGTILHFPTQPISGDKEFLAYNASLNSLIIQRRLRELRQAEARWIYKHTPTRRNNS